LEAGFQYFHAVALNLWREKLRDPLNRAESLGNAPELPVDPALESAKEDRRARDESRLTCLEACLAKLPEESRGILLRYHTTESGRIAVRKRLAAMLGIPLNALRIRVFRLRAALEECGRACIEGHVEGHVEGDAEGKLK
jgi:DNA-directed RNA polymerase specialized sigma24 family protein